VNIWLAVVVLVGLVLIAVVMVGVRRPRHAEDELTQPEHAPARVERAGALNQPPLNVFISSIQTERETGTLQVTAAGRTGYLYFLFGHLFHAVCGTQTGEAAVRECLAWHDVHYVFDKRPSLPTVETIERPLDEILG
jgi:hypothetical protein